jgi:hypothetical protein
LVVEWRQCDLQPPPVLLNRAVTFRADPRMPSLAPTNPSLHAPVLDLQVSQEFLLSVEKLTKVKNEMIAQMNGGLAKESKSPLLMLPTHLTKLPTGQVCLTHRRGKLLGGHAAVRRSHQSHVASRAREGGKRESEARGAEREDSTSG